MPINRSKTEPFRHLELLARKVVEGFITGLHKSPFHGFSVEFAEHRLYNTGESTRHIDWKLFGRTEKLFVKRYEEETNLRCQIVLDVSPSMLFPKDAPDTKLSFSVHAAAALCELLRMQRDAYGLTLFSSDIIRHLPAKGNPQHQKMVYSILEETLEAKHTAPTTAAASALNQVAEIIHQRSLVVIFSDMFETGAGNDELFAALQHLRYRKHEVVLFHVTDKSKEMEFAFDNRPYHFIDLESGEEVKLNPAQLKETYTSRLAKFRDELRIRCGNYSVDYVEADISEGFDTVLYTYLVKRHRMMK
jgi:uncharacterized protein (DUF58 family)